MRLIYKWILLKGLKGCGVYFYPIQLGGGNESTNRLQVQTNIGAC